MRTRSELHHALNKELEALRLEGFAPALIYLALGNRDLLGGYTHYKGIPLRTDRTLSTEFEIIADWLKR